MQSTLDIKNLTTSAFIITLGIVIPIVFHAVGMGSVFLPMYWPLAAGAFFLIPRWAVVIGVVTPTLSFILTGMPPISPPVLPVMIGELAILTVTISYLGQKHMMGVLWILIIGLILSKLVLIVAVWLISPLIGLPPGLITITSFVHGIPGTAIILFLVPLLIKRLTNRNIVVNETN